MKISYVLQEQIHYDDTEERETLTAEKNSAADNEVDVWLTFFCKIIRGGLGQVILVSFHVSQYRVEHR